MNIAAESAPKTKLEQTSCSGQVKTPQFRKIAPQIMISNEPQETLPFSKWNLPHLTFEFEHGGSFREILSHSKSIWHYEN